MNTPNDTATASITDAANTAVSADGGQPAVRTESSATVTRSAYAPASRVPRWRRG